MRRRFGPYAANVLTGARVALTPAFAVLICRGDGGLLGLSAAAVFALVAASDVWDGRVARRWGSDSRGGRIFDHFADIAFILVALSTYAGLGVTPWWVPATIGASFGFYVADSWLHPAASGGLIGSRIGHIAGVLNYSLIGVLVCNTTAGLRVLSEGMLHALFWLVPCYSALAVGARLVARRDGGALTARRCAPM
jgi:phosphatidylglycerophosphate synthase